jgi:GNAT superfamily N-acetyltransferase
MKEYDIIDAKAWTDFSGSASPSVKDIRGIKVFPVGGVYASITSNIDVLAFNSVVGLGIVKPLDEKVIDIILNKIEVENVKRFFIQIHPDVYTDDINKLLTSKNLYHYNNWVRLVRDSSSLPQKKIKLNIRRIKAEESGKFAEIAVNAFEWPGELINWLAAPVGRKNWFHYVAFDKDIPAATAAFYPSGEYAWFDFAATHPKHRGKGAQSALLAERIKDCRALGVKKIIVETAEQTPEKESPSYRNVLKAGFQKVYRRPNFIYVKK